MGRSALSNLILLDSKKKAQPRLRFFSLQRFDRIGSLMFGWASGWTVLKGLGGICGCTPKIEHMFYYYIDIMPGLRILLYDRSVTHVLIICVNHVLRIFSKLCPDSVHLLTKWTRYFQ